MGRHRENGFSRQYYSRCRLDCETMSRIKFFSTANSRCRLECETMSRIKFFSTANSRCRLECETMSRIKFFSTANSRCRLECETMLRIKFFSKPNSKGLKSHFYTSSFFLIKKLKLRKKIFWLNFCSLKLKKISGSFFS